jgi:uncharacterized protein involved in exopolysaccharide biosynthesis
MNEAQMRANEVSQNSDNEAFRFFDAAIVLARHKAVVLGLPAIVAIISAAVSFVLPNTYKATTKLLPPQQTQSGAAALLSQIGGVAGAAAGAAGLKNPNDLYIGMLKSRTIADRLIARHGLKEVYQTESQETARKMLDTNTAIAAGKDGIITIEVEDRDQKRVSQLANGYVEELLRLSKVLAMTEASQRRLFFEQQLELAKNNLAKAEVALKYALEKRGVVSVDTESRAVIETMARLKAQIANKEIQLNSMNAFVTTSNPDYRRAQEELKSLRLQLSIFENGPEDLSKQVERNPGGGTGIESIKLLRDVKYYQMLYDLLAKQYEVARLDEAKDSSIVQVMDPAVDPERRFKPRRTFIVMLSTLLALFIGISYVLVREAMRKALMSAQESQRWDELRALLRLKY